MSHQPIINFTLFYFVGLAEKLQTPHGTSIVWFIHGLAFFACVCLAVAALVCTKGSFLLSDESVAFVSRDLIRRTPPQEELTAGIPLFVGHICSSQHKIRHKIQTDSKGHWNSESVFILWKRRTSNLVPRAPVWAFLPTTRPEKALGTKLKERAPVTGENLIWSLSI